MRHRARYFVSFGLALGLLPACGDDAFEPAATTTTASSSGAGGAGGAGGATGATTSTTDAATTTGSTSTSATTGAGGAGGTGGTGGSSGEGGGGCVPKALDATATGKDCTVDTDCPDGYTCWTFNGFAVQMLCAILCEATCECPTGTTCKLQSDKGGSWKQCLE
jgi:hypothetical protein